MKNKMSKTAAFMATVTIATSVNPHVIFAYSMEDYLRKEIEEVLETEVQEITYAIEEVKLNDLEEHLFLEEKLSESDNKNFYKMSLPSELSEEMISKVNYYKLEKAYNSIYDTISLEERRPIKEIFYQEAFAKEIARLLGHNDINHEVNQQELDSITTLHAGVGTIFAQSGNQLRNLEGIQYLRRLSQLDLSAGNANTDTGSFVSNIDALVGFTTFQTLHLSNNNLRNIDGLSNLRSLTGGNLFGGGVLSLVGNDLENLDGLANLQSVSGTLDFSGMGLEHVNFLSSLTTVGGHLNLALNNLSDVNGLTSLVTVQHTMSLNNNRITNIDGLQNLRSVGSLILEHNSITDITPLGGLNLAILNLNNNQISDIEGLRTLNHTTSVQLNNNFVRDLRPLRRFMMSQFGTQAHNQTIRLDSTEIGVANALSIYAIGSSISLQQQPLQQQNAQLGGRGSIANGYLTWYFSGDHRLSFSIGNQFTGVIYQKVNYPPSYALQLLIEEIKDLSLQAYDFTENSWSHFDESLRNAFNLLHSTNDRAELINIREELRQALDNLISVSVQRDSLQVLFDQSYEKRFQETDFTVNTWHPFFEALRLAEVALPSRNLAQLENAYAVLREASANLSFIYGENENDFEGMTPELDGITVAVAELEALISEISERQLVSADFTEASWLALTGALANARTAIDSSDLEAIELATVRLQVAVEALVFAYGENPDDFDVDMPTFDGIVQAVAELEALKASILSQNLVSKDFTEASWMTLTEALDNVRGAIDSADPAQIELATSNLRYALEGLVFAYGENPYDFDVDMPTFDGIVQAVAELEALKAEILARNLVSVDFTEASWKVLTEALENVSGAIESADPAQIELATSNLRSAFEGLVFAYGENSYDFDGDMPTMGDILEAVAYLEALISKVVGQELVQADFTNPSWLALSGALAEARQAIDSSAPEAIQLATVRLREAWETLVFAYGENPSDFDGMTPDFGADDEVVAVPLALARQIAHALELTEADFTAETWNALVTALEQAKQVQASESELADFVLALQNLETALGGLDFAYGENPNDFDGSTPQLDGITVAVARLEALISEISERQLVSADFTEASWLALTEALANARTAIDSSDLEAIELATVRLQVAAEALVFAYGENPYDFDVDMPAFDGIVQAVAELEALKASILSQNLVSADFTEASWTTLTEALDNVRDAIGGADPAQIELATSNLRYALEGLVFAYGENLYDFDVDMPTFDGIVQAVAELEALKAEILARNLADVDFTETSWAVLIEALENVSGAIESADSAQIELVTSRLRSAFEGLVFAYGENPYDFDVDMPTMGDILEAVAYLGALISKVVGQELVQADFTNPSWLALSGALAEARQAIDSSNLEDIQLATVRLREAWETLVFAYGENPNDFDGMTPDFGADDEVVAVPLALARQIAHALELTEADFTAESWNALATALEQAKQVQASGLELSDFVLALQNLETALGGLEFAYGENENDFAGLTPELDGILMAVAGLEALISQIAERGLVSADFTEASWTILSEALANARLAIDNSDLEAIELAIVRLGAAFEGLVFVYGEDENDFLGMRPELEYDSSKYDNVDGMMPELEYDSSKYDNVGGMMPEVFVLYRLVALIDDILTADYQLGDFTYESWTALQNALAMAKQFVSEQTFVAFAGMSAQDIYLYLNKRRAGLVSTVLEGDVVGMTPELGYDSGKYDGVDGVMPELEYDASKYDNVDGMMPELNPIPAPEQPIAPEAPTAPEQPATPEQPETPTAPSRPTRPNRPSRPEREQAPSLPQTGQGMMLGMPLLGSALVGLAALVKKFKK